MVTHNGDAKEALVSEVRRADGWGWAAGGADMIESGQVTSMIGAGQARP